MRKYLDKRGALGVCPIATLRSAGFAAWIEIERDEYGAHDVLFTTATPTILAACCGHSLAFIEVAL